MTISIPTGTVINSLSMYTGNRMKSGTVTKETKCYIVVEFEGYYNDNKKLVRLFKREGTMYNYDNEFMYTRAEPEAPTAPIDPELLIIMQWLDNSDSVTQEQLEANKVKTVARVDSVIKGPKTLEFANALIIEAAAYSTTLGNKELAGKWVNKYFGASGEDRQDYINAIEGLK